MFRTMFRNCMLVTLVALFPAAARAQAEPAPGPWELTLSGSGSNDENFGGGSFNLDVGVGYFVDPTLELSLRQGIGYTDLTDEFSGSTRVGVNYHFDLDEWRPYLGANLSYLYGGEFADTFAAGPEAGVKYSLNDSTFLYGRVNYDFFFRNADNAGGDFSDGQFVYGLGIGFRF